MFVSEIPVHIWNLVDSILFTQWSKKEVGPADGRRLAGWSRKLARDGTTNDRTGALTYVPTTARLYLYVWVKAGRRCPPVGRSKKMGCVAGFEKDWELLK